MIVKSGVDCARVASLQGAQRIINNALSSHVNEKVRSFFIHVTVMCCILGSFTLYELCV